MPSLDHNSGAVSGWGAARAVNRKSTQLREVLFEFRRVGNFVRVSAIDPITRTEVQIVGDSKQGRETLKRVAIRKLEYVLGKRFGDGE